MFEDMLRKFKRKRQFKKNMKNWIKLCKLNPKKPLSKIIGVVKVGELTHSITIDNDYKISTKDPILISCE